MNIAFVSTTIKITVSIGCFSSSHETCLIYAFQFCYQGDLLSQLHHNINVAELLDPLKIRNVI